MKLKLKIVLNFLTFEALCSYMVCSYKKTCAEEYFDFPGAFCSLLCKPVDIMRLNSAVLYKTECLMTMVGWMGGFHLASHSGHQSSALCPLSVSCGSVRNISCNDNRTCQHLLYAEISDDILLTIIIPLNIVQE